MSDLYPVAGCHLYIGGVLSSKSTDFIASDFSAEVWTEIDGWEQMGAFGDKASVITTSLINRDRDLKQKGTSNAGQMQNVFATISGDAGQAALVAAGAPSVKDNYAFRIDFNDASGGGQPSKAYFIGLVMSTEEAGGTANTVRKLNATVEVNSNVVNVAAT